MEILDLVVAIQCESLCFLTHIIMTILTFQTGHMVDIEKYFLVQMQQHSLSLDWSPLFNI